MKYSLSDVFPSGDEVVPAIDLDGFGFRMRPCKLCGALVVMSGLGLHLQFHNDLDPL